MPHRVKRTRLALGVLLLGTLLLAPATAQRAAAAESGVAAGGGALAAGAERSVLARFEDLLHALAGDGDARLGKGPTAKTRSGLHAVHGGAGCGIDPNGVYHCT